MTNVTTKTRRPGSGEALALSAMSVGGVVVAVALAIFAAVGGGDYASPTEVAARAALSWWSGFALVVALASFVGLLVVEAVRKMLTRR